MRVQKSAFDVLQEDAEAFMVDLLSKVGAAANHRGRETITVKDMQFMIKHLDYSVLFQSEKARQPVVRQPVRVRLVPEPEHSAEHSAAGAQRRRRG